MQILIKNGLILQNNGTFVKGHVGIDQGKITALWYNDPPLVSSDTQQIDADRYLVSPGFIDTHVHGGMGFDFCYETEGWEKLEVRLSSSGVTSILVTSSALPPDLTLRFINRAAVQAEKNHSSQVDILGIHLEGPYLNKNKKATFLEENIRPGDIDEVKVILERAGGWAKCLGLANGLVRVWTLAPDIAENMTLVKTLATAGISVSIAHTEADYDTAMAAFSAGANRVTHTFNTMPVLHHRYKGIINAAWQHGAYMELIADIHHVSPTIARMFVAATDPGKVVLVTDNIEFAGLPDGNYAQGKQRYVIAEGQIKTDWGIFAGSIVCMNQCVLNMTHWGFSAGTALKMATENPARSIGFFDRKGSITPGKDADVVILDNQFEVMLTIKGGQIVYRRDRF